MANSSIDVVLVVSPNNYVFEDHWFTIYFQLYIIAGFSLIFYSSYPRTHSQLYINNVLAFLLLNFFKKFVFGSFSFVLSWINHHDAIIFCTWFASGLVGFISLPLLYICIVNKYAIFRLCWNNTCTNIVDYYLLFII